MRQLVDDVEIAGFAPEIGEPPANDGLVIVFLRHMNFSLLRLTVAFDGDDSGHANMLAGSGNAPASTTYSQPTGSEMTVGVTATDTTPPSAPAVAVATPPVKAG